jgi:hypothetical protein
MADQLVDIVMVAMEAKAQRKKARAFVPTDELRRDAVRAYAEQEYRKKRFKTMDSAEKSIHDACSRRLKPDVTSIDDFDRLLEGWLKKGSRSLAQVLYRHAKTQEQRELVRVFFDSSADDGTSSGSPSGR